VVGVKMTSTATLQFALDQLAMLRELVDEHGVEQATLEKAPTAQCPDGLSIYTLRLAIPVAADVHMRRAVKGTEP